MEMKEGDFERVDGDMVTPDASEVSSEADGAGGYKSDQESVDDNEMPREDLGDEGRPVSDDTLKSSGESTTVTAGPTNAVLKQFVTQTKATAGKEHAWRLDSRDGGNGIDVRVEDIILYKSKKVFSHAMTQEMVGVSEECKADIVERAKSVHRLYALMKYALNNPAVIKNGDSFEIPSSADFFDKATLLEATEAKNWAILVGQYDGNKNAVDCLFTVKTKMSIVSGSQGSKYEYVIDGVRKENGNYFIAWLLSRQLNKQSDRLGLITHKTSNREEGPLVADATLWEMLRQDEFGFTNTSYDSVIDITSDSFTGVKGRVFGYVLDRLRVIRDEAARSGTPQSIFSEIAGEVKENFITADVGLDQELESHDYGCFANMDAMLSFMLAASELTIIRSCAGMVKTLMLQAKHGGSYPRPLGSGATDTDIGGLQDLLRVTSVMMGYDIRAVLESPSQFSSIAYSRIGVDNLGSLAAVWLATHRGMTYEQLLTAGHRETAPFIGYARSVPFVQALIMHCLKEQNASGGNADKPKLANIRTSDVVRVFSEIAMITVQITPGFESGTSKFLSEVDQQLVSTLFYGALSADAWSAERQSAIASSFTSKLQSKGGGMLNETGDEPPVGQNVRI